MNEKLIFGQYYNANSIIHKLDPRVKLFCLIILMTFTFLIPFNNFYILGGLFLFVFIVIMLTRVPILKYLQSLRQLILLLLISFAFQIFTRKDGVALLTINLGFNYLNIIIVTLSLIIYFLIRRYLPLKLLFFILLLILDIYIFTNSFSIPCFYSCTLYIYKGGVISGTFIVLRVLAIILVSTTLTLTTKPMDLSLGLEWYLKPFELIGLKTSILTMMISIALRFIPTLFNETNKILKAQASRGVDFKEGKFHEQVRQVISLLIPMFVISFKRAIELADAMQARGYIPGAKRTRLLVMKCSLKDIIATILMFLILAFIIFWRIYK